MPSDVIVSIPAIGALAFPNPVPGLLPGPVPVRLQRAVVAVLNVVLELLCTTTFKRCFSIDCPLGRLLFAPMTLDIVITWPSHGLSRLSLPRRHGKWRMKRPSDLHLPIGTGHTGAALCCVQPTSQWRPCQ